MEEMKISLRYQIFLGNHLHYGDGKRIAKEVGSHPVYVSQIINGNRPAKTTLAKAIIKKAQEIVRGYYKDREAEMNQFQSNLNEFSL